MVRLLIATGAVIGLRLMIVRAFRIEERRVRRDGFAVRDDPLQRPCANARRVTAQPPS